MGKDSKAVVPYKPASSTSAGHSYYGKSMVKVDAKDPIDLVDGAAKDVAGEMQARQESWEGIGRIVAQTFVGKMLQGVAAGIAKMAGAPRLPLADAAELSSQVMLKEALENEQYHLLPGIIDKVIEDNPKLNILDFVKHITGEENHETEVDQLLQLIKVNDKLFKVASSIKDSRAEESARGIITATNWKIYSALAKENPSVFISEFVSNFSELLAKGREAGGHDYLHAFIKVGNYAKEISDPIQRINFLNEIRKIVPGFKDKSDLIANAVNVVETNCGSEGFLQKNYQQVAQLFREVFKEGHDENIATSGSIFRVTEKMLDIETEKLLEFNKELASYPVRYKEFNFAKRIPDLYSRIVSENIVKKDYGKAKENLLLMYKEGGVVDDRYLAGELAKSALSFSEKIDLCRTVAANTKDDVVKQDALTKLIKLNHDYIKEKLVSGDIETALSLLKTSIIKGEVTSRAASDLCYESTKGLSEDGVDQLIRYNEFLMYYAEETGDRGVIIKTVYNIYAKQISESKKFSQEQLDKAIGFLNKYSEERAAKNYLERSTLASMNHISSALSCYDKGDFDGMVAYFHKSGVSGYNDGVASLIKIISGDKSKDDFTVATDFFAKLVSSYEKAAEKLKSDDPKKLEMLSRANAIAKDRLHSIKQSKHSDSAEYSGYRQTFRNVTANWVEKYGIHVSVGLVAVAIAIGVVSMVKNASVDVQNDNDIFKDVNIEKLIVECQKYIDSENKEQDEKEGKEPSSAISKRKKEPKKKQKESKKGEKVPNLTSWISLFEKSLDPSGINDELMRIVDAVRPEQLPAVLVLSAMAAVKIDKKEKKDQNSYKRYVDSHIKKIEDRIGVKFTDGLKIDLGMFIEYVHNTHDGFRDAYNQNPEQNTLNVLLRNFGLSGSGKESIPHAAVGMVKSVQKVAKKARDDAKEEERS